MLKSSLIPKTDSIADKSQIYVDGDIRVTYITSKLLRVETGRFYDEPSYAVWNRRFPAGEMETEKDGNKLYVQTEDILLVIKKGVPYSVILQGSRYEKEKAEKAEKGETEEEEEIEELVFGEQKNFKGTARTLDGKADHVHLEKGFITAKGAFLFDDSKSFLIDENGRFKAREGGRDFYVFAYGKDYRETMRAFYMISSPAPLVPRFALGVWWSRYHAYTDKEYLSLMDRFASEDIPLTVATVDMDWHWVAIKEKFGIKYSGWTGYSWNTDLFPDYREFLKELKARNLRVTLNLHPADGVRSFEDMYDEMAKANGIDPKTKQPVEFRCGSDDFWNSYFDVIHKPYEKDGVDFWWIDWQQGKSSDVEGLDPLIALNHYHYLDNAENGDIPLILSRYGGVGSHRYPLGFSGDTFISWRALDFQPYFTANAANAGYGWWSHDIGGHMLGRRDDEMYLRWIQFAVFSPVLRLHSSNLEFLGKEPWKYRKDVCEDAKRWLRFRHKLIPYIYSLDRIYNEQGIAVCEPMYYNYPEEENAYSVPNQYQFGSQLIVCPITSKLDKKMGLARAGAWIPDGEWVDIFTLQRYSGNMMICLNRELYDIPVLAKAGSVIPMSADEGNSCGNPETLEVWVFKGDGEFTMYEDNGKTDYAQHTIKTVFTNKYDKETNSIKLGIRVEGDLSVIPKGRKYRIVFRDTLNEDITVDFSADEITVDSGEIKDIPKESPREIMINLMSRWQKDNLVKMKPYAAHLRKAQTADEILAALGKCGLPVSVELAIAERMKEK
ncbi:MAG: DUF5110 domain-containing protein [Clostridia bacterium]|nr:DUF5110 domain-containing protein [Clostridia bacterium]